MKKIINVIPYDNNWPIIFKIHSKEIKKALGNNVIKIHHIGSTSIPDLCAKPTIDIMCVVKDLKIITAPLKSIGYIGKGELNLPLRLFFNKKITNSINLHVLTENNGEIEWNLCFLDFLRKNKEARDMYAKAKLDLIKQNPNGFNILHNSFPEYTIEKSKVIRKIAKMSGFNGYRFVIVNTDDEIRDYKTLLNVEKIDIETPNIFNLSLYKGVEITASVCMSFDKKNKKALICCKKFLNSESKKIMLDKIEEWTKFKGLTLIVDR